MDPASPSQPSFPTTHPARAELAPPDYFDPVIEAYKKDVDRTLLRENLKLTVQERFRKFEQFMLEERRKLESP